MAAADWTDSTPISHLGRSAKFSIPARPADLLRRPRLLEFLHEHIHRKLVLISAAAGYGKSSLLVDLIHDTDYRVAYCRLDEADHDLAVLVPNLVAALRHAFPAFQSVLPAQVVQASSTPAELAEVLAREIETGLDEYFLLVLDDFDLIQAPPVLRFFDSLLATLPEQAHLLMAGRTLPPLDTVILLAAHEQIAGLSEEHLRFTPDEVQALLQLRNKVAVPQREAEELVAQTEGWITGILLTSHLLWQGLMASLLQARQSQAPLYTYLANEVLDRQPSSLKEFLLESAVLPEMEASVCDAVLDRSDSAELLQEVESRRLFVSVVGDEARTYQYHHLFRDFLIARLRAQDEQRLKALQACAADWYAANGMAEAAVTFYVMAHRLAPAVRVAEANAGAIFRAGHHATLRRWAEQLAPVAQDAPRLHLFLARVESDAGQLEVADNALDIAAAGFARIGDRAGSVDADLQRSLLAYRRGEFEGGLSLALASLPKARKLGRPASTALALRYTGLCQFALGQLAPAEESLQQAVQLLQTSQYRYDLAWTLHDYALILRACGQTARASHAQQQALAIWREQPAPGPLASALNNVGWDLHMLGQYETSLSTYGEALDWARRAGSFRLEAMILAGQADVFADLGDRSAATELCRQAMAKAEQVGDWALTAYLRRGMARLDRWSGNYIGALEWLRRAELASGDGRAESLLANLEALRGIILVEMGHIQDGRALLDRVCANLEQSRVPVDLAQALLFRACAEFRDGDPEEAGGTLARALEVAEQVGYDQMLVSEAHAARDLLEACRTRPGIGPRVAGLLARAENLGSTLSRLRRSDVSLVATSTRRSPASFQVQILGRGQVLKDGVEIPREVWGSPRARELFLFLVDRAPISRDRVLETFWPEKSPARALNNLYQLLFRVRRALGHEVVILKDLECRLAPTLSMDYDVVRFEAAGRAALALERGDLRQVGALASAIELYTGDYLTDLLVEWPLERRRELSELHVSLLRAYADALMNLTRYAEAREVLARALTVEPLRDDFHERMLVCLAALGRRHEVVDHYRHYRETLLTELGLDPPPELRRLYGGLIE